MPLNLKFKRTASALVLAGSAALAGCSTTQISADGMRVREVRTPFTNTVRTTMDTGAVHQTQIEMLCRSQFDGVRDVGVAAVDYSQGDAAFRLQRERDLAEARRLADVPQPANATAGACNLGLYGPRP